MAPAGLRSGLNTVVTFSIIFYLNACGLNNNYFLNNSNTANVPTNVPKGMADKSTR